MKNNKQLKELFDTFSKDFKELLNEDEQPTLEKGRWYYCKSSTGSKGCLFIFERQVGSKVYYSFFIDLNKNQTMAYDYFDNHNMANSIRPATNSEIIEMAKNYLENTLGFTKGCKFKSAASGDEFEYDGIYADIYGLIWSNSDGCLFSTSDGKWATLIKDEPLLWLDGSEIEIVNEYAYIEKHYFIDSQIEILLPAHPIFQKILDRMNQTN